MAAVVSTGDKVYDITECPVHLCPSFVGRKILTMQEEEAVLASNCCLGCHSVSNRPYGELGSVETHKCCCCIGFVSNLSSTSSEGQVMPIMPACGCEGALVEEIVRELKTRMKARGDTGQIKRAEENLEQIKYLHAKMDAVMTHLQVPAVEAPMKMEPRP